MECAARESQGPGAQQRRRSSRDKEKSLRRERKQLLCPEPAKVTENSDGNGNKLNGEEGRGRREELGLQGQRR